MPIVNRDCYPDEVFFEEADFLEIGKRFDGARIIQIGKEGDAPLVAFSYTNDPISENLNPIELWSLMTFSQDPKEYEFYSQPRSLDPNIQVIHKFQIPEQGEFFLNLELSAEILTVEFQKGNLHLWALLNPRKSKVKRDFLWIPTGEEIKHRKIKYVTTLQANAGKKVSHLFEIKVDYGCLENLLAKEKWKEADLETFRILRKLCGIDESPDGESVSEAGVKNISSVSLTTINRLWMKYSNGRFGYTTQISIAQDLGNAGESWVNDPDTWKNFCTKLGWNTGFSVLDFSLKAPKGHLPATVGRGMGYGPCGCREIYRTLWSKLKEYESEQ